MAIIDFSSTVVKPTVFYALALQHKLYDHVFHREYWRKNFGELVAIRQTFYHTIL